MNLSAVAAPKQQRGEARLIAVAIGCTCTAQVVTLMLVPFFSYVLILGQINTQTKTESIQN